MQQERQEKDGSYEEVGVQQEDTKCDEDGTSDIADTDSERDAFIRSNDSGDEASSTSSDDSEDDGEWDITST